MYSRKIKAGVFLIEGLNALSTTYYFYFIYYYMQEQFQFGKLQNLILAATLGALYMVFSLLGGKIGQKKGYFQTLRLGFLIMAVATLCGAWAGSITLHLILFVTSLIGMAFTLPVLEAMTSEGETPESLPRMVGIYNVVWAGLGAVAYFSGGWVMELWGRKGIFLVPGVIHLFQFFLASKFHRLSKQETTTHIRPAVSSRSAKAESDPETAAVFQKLAWIANPFAYLAINTVVAVMPSLAKDLGLTAARAGVICSIWLFMRTAAFLLLWWWPAWHYKFRWLILGYLSMVASFILILVGPNLGILIVAQIFFGLAIGLMYYSSLYYSMDASDTKGEHGGLHEAVIGAGSCAGPAISAAAIQFFPLNPNLSTWAASGLLVVGLVGILTIQMQSRRVAKTG